MSVESVRAHLKSIAPELSVIELTVSTATVGEAAAAHGVEPGRIAKTLSLRVGGQVVLVVARGDSRLDNKKLRSQFGGKAKMLDVAEVEQITGHPVGGVSPFGLKSDLPVYCDVAMQEFDEVIPAAGAVFSSVKIAPLRLAELVGATWVDVCEG